MSNIKYKIGRIIGPVWYRFFGYKHHIVKTSLTPAVWYDTDTRILYAVMDLVKWYVDNDMMDPWDDDGVKSEIERIKAERTELGWSEDFINDEIGSIKRSHEADMVAIEIAKWWENYPNREKEIDEENNYEKANALEDQLDKEEQEMLIKAIEWRKTMWS